VSATTVARRAFRRSTAYAVKACSMWSIEPFTRSEQFSVRSICRASVYARLRRSGCAMCHAVIHIDHDSDTMRLTFDGRLQRENDGTIRCSRNQPVGQTLSGPSFLGSRRLSRRWYRGNSLDSINMRSARSRVAIAACRTRSRCSPSFRSRSITRSPKPSSSLSKEHNSCRLEIELARRMLSVRRMDKTPCLHCGRVGLVRYEVVVKGRETSLTFYCGYCEKTWQQADRRVNHPARGERSSRGRGATG
jgi:hypothetical protein